MSLSLNLITSTADCDALIAMVNGEKDDLDYRIQGLERQKNNYSSTSFNVSNELSRLQADLANCQAQMALMQPGSEDYSDEEIKIAKINYQILQLNKRKKDYGNIALVNKELDLERAQVQMARIDACLSDIAARKAALE